jgi:hypothetical protein
VEFLNSSNLEVLNKGNEPTFCNVSRWEVIDITLGTYELLDSIMEWEVSLEPSPSDHRHILFTLRGSVPVPMVRNPRATDFSWELYREAQRWYRGEVPKASKETWRSFCGSINNLPRAARIHKALSGTLKLDWVPWWLLQDSVCNLKGNPWTSCSLHTSRTPTGGAVHL